MKIYYLDNSGFALEIGNTLLVIDCYSFTEHPEKSRFEKGYVDYEKLPGYQKVYVLASHIHGDHFNPEIFELVRYNKNTFYILEKDIPAPGGVSAAFLGVGETFSDGTIFVRAWPSTDIGVSFEIKIEGKSIFHAGDLNCWHWREESTEEEIAEAEENFAAALDLIAKAVRQPDLAFFPVDPRMGKDHDEGAVAFIKKIKPKAFIPMHFGRRFDAAAAFREKMADYKIYAPKERGEEIVL